MKLFMVIFIGKKQNVCFYGKFIFMM